LPFCHLRLTSKKPVNKGYPRELKTIGDHIRKERLDRGQQQTQVALLICVDKTTIMNWERGHRTPAIRHIPAIIRFLGYVPFSVGDSLPERLRAYRRIRGLSRKKLARILGLPESRGFTSAVAGGPSFLLQSAIPPLAGAAVPTAHTAPDQS
jgi:transcriptional regulator with XRE-family HTH domain